MANPTSSKPPTVGNTGEDGAPQKRGWVKRWRWCLAALAVVVLLALALTHTSYEVKAICQNCSAYRLSDYSTIGGFRIDWEITIDSTAASRFMDRALGKPCVHDWATMWAGIGTARIHGSSTYPADQWEHDLRWLQENCIKLLSGVDSDGTVEPIRWTLRNTPSAEYYEFLAKLTYSDQPPSREQIRAWLTVLHEKGTPH